MKTIKVRMLLAANARGEWHAFGWRGATDVDLADEMDDCINFDGGVRYWIECEVPLPQDDGYPVIAAQARAA